MVEKQVTRKARGGFILYYQHVIELNHIQHKLYPSRSLNLLK